MGNKNTAFRCTSFPGFFTTANGSQDYACSSKRFFRIGLPNELPIGVRVAGQCDLLAFPWIEDHHTHILEMPGVSCGYQSSHARRRWRREARHYVAEDFPLLLEPGGEDTPTG